MAERSKPRGYRYRDLSSRVPRRVRTDPVERTTSTTAMVGRTTALCDDIHTVQSDIIIHVSFKQDGENLKRPLPTPCNRPSTPPVRRPSRGRSTIPATPCANSFPTLTVLSTNPTGSSSRWERSATYRASRVSHDKPVSTVFNSRSAVSTTPVAE